MSSAEEDESNQDQVFVKTLRNHVILLDKSQTPNVKELKRKQRNEMIEQL